MFVPAPKILNSKGFGEGVEMVMPSVIKTLSVLIFPPEQDAPIVYEV
ncbi:MAG: hypothetical protein UT76_C0004G0003 [Candidatus Woesebacteria bacterium GW2011_GWB1_40_12]|uniref:Uncharacterized protein n=1 Tax=Candidatus Woesebacteria bacterium GW2011_GWB1_40_12 TaxID=1618576 RepID=A0A0G0TCN1_9BACT|nr:MAG: hypothetical protein UT76_C0004G0003 [Candidatus Woesebacteria bacterium GW2011_GWB1_40_12]